MVNRKNLEKKYVLISVYNKINLAYLCKNLKRHSINFISTGSTCKKIKSLGFSCQEISSLTKFKEILTQVLINNCFECLDSMKANLQLCFPKNRNSMFENLRFPGSGISRIWDSRISVSRI